MKRKVKWWIWIILSIYLISGMVLPYRSLKKENDQRQADADQNTGQISKDEEISFLMAAAHTKEKELKNKCGDYGMEWFSNLQSGNTTWLCRNLNEKELEEKGYIINRALFTEKMMSLEECFRKKNIAIYSVQELDDGNIYAVRYYVYDMCMGKAEEQVNEKTGCWQDLTIYLDQSGDILAYLPVHKADTENFQTYGFIK